MHVQQLSTSTLPSLSCNLSLTKNSRDVIHVRKMCNTTQGFVKRTTASIWGAAVLARSLQILPPGYGHYHQGMAITTRVWTCFSKIIADITTRVWPLPPGYGHYHQGMDRVWTCFSKIIADITTRVWTLPPGYGLSTSHAQDLSGGVLLSADQACLLCL